MAGRRRGRGEGSIYRRKDDRWVGQYEVNGKRRYVYGRTRKEVAEKSNKAIAQRDAGLVSQAAGGGGHVPGAPDAEGRGAGGEQPGRLGVRADLPARRWGD